MRTNLLRAQGVLASLVVLLFFVQVYLIASFFFGADDALDAHEGNGGAIVHPLEVLVFLVGVAAWWRNWRMVGISFLLPLLGTIQIFMAEGEDWVGGLHGLLAVFVAGLAAHIALKAFRTARRGDYGRDDARVAT